MIKKIPIIDVNIKQFKLNNRRTSNWVLIKDVPGHKKWINRISNRIVFINNEMNENTFWYIYTGIADDRGGELEDVGRTKTKREAENAAKALMEGFE